MRPEATFDFCQMATRLTAEAARLWATGDIEAAQRCFAVAVALVEGYRVVERTETSDR